MCTDWLVCMMQMLLFFFLCKIGYVQAQLDLAMVMAFLSLRAASGNILDNYVLVAHLNWLIIYCFPTSTFMQNWGKLIYVYFLFLLFFLVHLLPSFVSVKQFFLFPVKMMIWTDALPLSLYGTCDKNGFLSTY